ncbi:MAG: flavodoxin-dependent (E)-4-hydroxy-3-methylbut-2-enyl-diphosphate synthase [Candidatus Marinimicrobia bacterium]|nr:flavodoxin-dependent (E)-4-hydroxy-3-methylbut-2-enyl-diphosphate synthase [Candidatus Neomarinimicrobiota bacterium]
MKLITRRHTRQVMVRGVPIGGGAAIPVQSMTTAKTDDAAATLREVERLGEAGCQIVRITVPNKAAAKGFAEVRKHTDLPLVADIHFDYRMALAAVDAGADKIRINPGNIGSRERVKEVIAKVQGAGLPIRIGVNAGSLEKEFLEKYGYPTPEAMVESAEKHIEVCREHGFEDIIVSLKASDVPLMMAAYRLFSLKYDYPLHLGVTEAGPPKSGTIKSAVGIGALLADGIGDTIRVSLTSDPVEEVKVGFQLLKSLGLASRGVTLVACPTCGRIEVDLFKLAAQVEQRLEGVDKTLTVALMGCAVNGPGEAADADLGIAFGKDGGLLYRDGKKVGRVSEADALDRLMAEIEAFNTKDSHDPD